MKKNLLILLGLLIALPSYARDFEYTYEGQTLTYTVLDESAKTCETKSCSTSTSGNSVSGTLVIPETASDGSNEYSVTTIGNYAFALCRGLTSVTIPNSVTTIGSYAFEDCSGLTSVTIPNSVTTIGSYAFEDCSGLTSVTIGESVTTIRGAAFHNCYGLTSVTIPNSVTTIDGYAFYGCSGLTSVTIPNSVTAIGSSAFYSCRALTSVTIPNSVTDIGEAAFCKCINLTLAPLPESITSINKDTFAFTALTSVTIPKSVTSIGFEAFSDCTKLTSVTIPNSVVTIEGLAFYNCSALTSVTIGSSVTSINGSAFNGCNGLTLVKVLATEPTEYSGFSGDALANAVLDVPVGTLKKYAVSAWGAFNKIREDGVMSKTYNDGVFKYRLLPDAVNPEAVLIKGDYSAMEEVSIPERFTDESDPTNPVRYTISTIGANAFSGCSDLKEVNFHSRSKITTIAYSAFSNCSGLTEVSIPENVTTIGSYAFYECSGLTSVTIPETVTTIGRYAFDWCNGLTKAEFASIESLCNINFANYYANPLYYAHHLYINGEEITDVVIPESVTTIGNGAFSGCRGLTSVTIPNSVTTIGNYAFDLCTGLTSVAIPNSVASIGRSAFSGCSGLTSVTIPNSVTSIGEDAFYCCSGLTSVSIGNSLSELDSSVFNYCDAISSLTLADGGNYLELQGEASWLDNVTNLYLGRNMMTPEGAFVKFPALTDLEIGEEITEITPSAFSGYSGLASLKLSNAVAKIGSNAFAGCSSLTSVAIPNSVNSLGNRAFSGCSALTDLTIGNSVPTVSSTVFEGCTAIKTLTVADGPGTLSFQSGNSWLTNVTKLYMGRNMAYSTGGDLKFPAVSDLTVGNEVTEIGSSMFANCALTEVALGNSLQTIGGSAFSGCSLTEVVVPPSVETIEASAFAGNNDLATIIMGHNVKTIGEKAYDGCAAQTIRITALTPPTAPNNTFSRYTGQLWVANAQAVEDYYNAYTCWDRFSAYAMIEPEEIKIEGAQTIDAVPGDTIRLTATISPDNVTLPQIFWRSTNPAIATVDNDGVVVVRGAEPEISTYAQGDDDYTEGGCRIIAESLYADAPIAVVAINSELADIEDIVIDRKESRAIDYSQPYDVYNMQGVWLGRSADAVAPGFYILRQGSKAAKIMK